jgi:hypothetical protein
MDETIILQVLTIDSENYDTINKYQDIFEKMTSTLMTR